jgi:hypothetical protein
MFSAETIVDVRNDRNCDNGSDAKGSADETEQSTVWVVEVWESPCQ